MRLLLWESKSSVQREIIILCKNRKIAQIVKVLALGNARG